jgi:hypothetical protein
MARAIGPVLGAVLVLAAVGWQADGDETEAASAEPYAGTWAQLRVQTAVVDLPLLGRSTVTTTTVLRLRLTASGRNLHVAAEACSIEQDTGTSLAEVEFPEKLVKHAGRFDTDAAVRREGGAVKFFQPRRWLLFGARLSDPGNDSLPTDPADEHVIDQDEDGEPGVTVRVRGLVDAELYLVQRAWTTLRGTATADRIDGLIQWGEEHSVLGSTSRLLSDLPPSRPDPDPQASSFRTTRIASDVDCAAILASRDTLFAR